MVWEKGVNRASIALPRICRVIKPKDGMRIFPLKSQSLSPSVRRMWELQSKERAHARRKGFHSLSLFISQWHNAKGFLFVGTAKDFRPVTYLNKTKSRSVALLPDAKLFHSKAICHMRCGICVVIAISLSNPDDFESNLKHDQTSDALRFVWNLFPFSQNQQKPFVIDRSPIELEASDMCWSKD